jgi:phosphinothricin acetyltransferase
VSREIRNAQLGDAEAVAAIHDEAVLAGNATFRTEPRPLAEVEKVLREVKPFLVALDNGKVVGWAGASPYEESNPYYDGVREVGVYVGGSSRGAGIGQALLDALADAAAEAGVFKLVAKVFDTNTTSLRLFERAGYSKVGVHVRHGRLRGEWKDVVVFEKPIGEGLA